MKKSLCIVLSAVLIACSFAACKGKDGDGAEKTKLNSDGQAYVEVTDTHGDAVTDADGEAVTSIVSAKDKDGKTSGKSDGGKTSSDNSNAPTGNPIDDLVAKEDDLLPDGEETGSKTTLRDDIISDAFKSQKFTLVTSIVSGKNKVPATIAVDGDNMAAQMAYDFMGTGSTMKCRFIMKDKYTYVTLDDMKMYMKMDSGEIGGIGGITEINDNQTYIKTTEVKEGNVKLTCEEYKNNDDGTISKYYFEGKNWKRLEVVNGDEIFVYEISKFSKSVDSALFSLYGLKEFNPNSLPSMS